MKKLVVEIPYPETMPVKAPTEWTIKYLGTYTDIYKVYLVEHIINFLQKYPTISQEVIDDHNIRDVFIDGLIKRFNSKYLDAYDIKQNITTFLSSYRSGSGLDIDDYKFEYEVTHNGDKIGIVGEIYTYKDEADLVRCLISNSVHTSSGESTYVYKIVDCDSA